MPVVPGAPQGPEAGRADDQQSLDDEGQWVHLFLPAALFLAASEAAEGAADAAFAVHQRPAAVGTAEALQESNPAHRFFSPEHAFFLQRRLAERLFFVKGISKEIFVRQDTGCGC